MKIYYQNKAAKLQRNIEKYSCKKCPFCECLPCPFYAPTDINCDGKGWWVDGELSDIFKV
jgi:hypothetical protein